MDETISPATAAREHSNGQHVKRRTKSPKSSMPMGVLTNCGDVRNDAIAGRHSSVLRMSGSACWRKFMTSNFKVLISTCALAVACGGSNNEANSADDANNPAPTPVDTTPSTPPESAPPSDAAPADGTTPGGSSPEAPTPPTSMGPTDGELLPARSSVAMPAEGANAGKTGSGGKTGKTGTTGGSSSSTGGTSSKSE